MFFDEMERAPADPIVGINADFLDDSRNNKVNLSIGAYKTAELRSLVLSTIRKAEALLLQEEVNKDYLPIDGHKDFIRHISRLVFGDIFEADFENRVYGMQAVGGTGALRVLGEFLAQEVSRNIFIPDPSWPNHKPIFLRCGMDVGSYSYYNAAEKVVDIDKMCSDLGKLAEGSIVVLHACCHNPTGMDPSLEQWREILTVIKKQKLLPFFDFAYQGFGAGLDEDAQAVRLFAQELEEFVVAYSCSKNLGMYGERVGAAFVVVKDKDVAGRVASQVKPIIRSNYSNPPIHGVRIVNKVLSTPVLREEWERELKNMRERIASMRGSLAAGLSAHVSKDFDFMRRQHGFFSFIGLDSESVVRLRTEFGIYMPSSGRINVAGLTPQNIDYVIEGILSL